MSASWEAKQFKIFFIASYHVKKWRENQREINTLALMLGAMAILMHQSLHKAPIDSQEQPPD